VSDRPASAGACARAELLWILHAGGALLLARTADLLGFEERPVEEASIRSGVEPGRENDRPPGPSPPSQPPKIAPAKLWNAQFWRLEGYEPLAQQASEPRRVISETPTGWTRPPGVRPAIHGLAPWPELRRRLRPQLTEPQEGPEPDLERLVARIGRGLLLERVPRLRQRRIGPALQLVFDRSERLAPFWSDQDQVAGELARVLAAEAMTRAVSHEGLTEPRLLDQAQPGYRPPPAGGVVLVLGDLGCLAASGIAALWLRIGQRIAAGGCRPVALVPCRRSRVPAALQRVWRILPWERPPGVAQTIGHGLNAQPDDLAVRRARARRLLTLLAQAVRIEPGLLRAVRLSLADPAFDASVEADCWQDPAVASTHSEAATLNPKMAADLRTAFATEPPAVQRRVLALLRIWHGPLPEEIWFEEILNLDQKVRDALLAHQDLEQDPQARADVLDANTLEQDLHDARRFFRYLCAQLVSDPDADAAGAAWVRRMGERATAIWRDEVIGTPLLELDWVMHRHRPDYRPPVPIDPAALPAPGLPVRRIALSQVGANVSFHALGRSQPLPGSPLAILQTRNRLVQIEASGSRSRDVAFWESGEPPLWVDSWGWDDHGAWVELAIRDSAGERVTQRLRWIPPGRFTMGSPPDEPGRYDDEGPPHEVTIRDGFWLFDTPCTQALWEAVMDGNPSRFKGPDRPVEQVSWEDAQGFLRRINERIPGLDLVLPSEAQWEHACRAGTETALYTGPIEILGDANAPALDPIAWYRGNSGVDFELEDGWDSSDWRDVQYPNPKSGTHPVKGKQPNAWGLYDMLGNVWEWTQDTWHDNYIGAPADGAAWESGKAGAVRVIRGGSWGSDARDCRCACRGRDRPGDRSNGLGFRCARAQGREPGKYGEVAERANLARPGPRSGSGRAAPNSARGAAVSAGADAHERDRLPVLLRLDAGPEATAPLPTAPAILIRTDREQLTLRRMTEPGWASAIGRDRYGLWTEIAVEPSQGEPVIQRLRWIPPGRFTMGSPEEEPGRWGAEGPQHAVVLGRGYWLFDTPCTQALWEAVLGENPSRFQDPSRPVERVSWEDVQQRFLPALNERIPGFVLPSEAQWEYACRAGTQTALYTGPIEISGENNAPALDPIAWYGGNSSVGFELEEGVDSSGWPEKQYPGDKAGTHPVKGKQPNPWGLYDILGNVWEWCEDAWYDNYLGAPADGVAWESDKADADRVIRGGSWFDLARSCRCAYRFRYRPGLRNDDLGFRCARVQES
jgi:formylglycine-generating enzyme required for sulfatase activity